MGFGAECIVQVALAESSVLYYFSGPNPIMRKLVSIAVFLLVLSSVGFSQQQVAHHAKTDNIRKVLELTGSAKLGIQVMDQMLASFQKSLPSVDSSFWTAFRNEVSADDLINQIIPIYDEHFTAEDIDAMVAFYSSPAGKRITAALPEIMKESMAAGEIWGRQISDRIIERLKEKKYLKM